MFLFIFTLRYVIAPFRYLSRPLISAALAPALPWRVDWIHGARDSGGQRAWVSADPVGLSQRRSGGHESAAIRRALSQRRAGGHWVRGGPAGIESEAGRRALSQRRAGGVISRERRAWGSGNPGTRQPAGGLGRATAGGRYLPRSAGMRARGQRTRGTRGDPAELPRRPAVGYGGRTSGDFLATGQTEEQQNKRLSKTENKTGWMGAAYGWVWSSVTVHTRGRNKDTQTRT